MFQRGLSVRCVLSAGRDVTALRQAGCPPLRKRGGSRLLPELFQAAGCRFEFSAKTIQPLTKLLREELEKL
jgi:hypothetical protein